MTGVALAASALCARTQKKADATEDLRKSSTTSAELVQTIVTASMRFESQAELIMPYLCSFL
jgi:hypothetical protein